MQNNSLMQCYFFRYLLRFLYNLAGFQSNIKKIKEQSPRKILQVCVGKTSSFVSTDATICCKQIVNAWQCGKQIRITGFFFSGKIFFCMKTVGMSYIYHFSGLQKRKHFQIKVIHGIFRELL